MKIPKVLYHGTSMKSAIQMFEMQLLKLGADGKCWMTSSPIEAMEYAEYYEDEMNDDEGAIVELEVDSDETPLTDEGNGTYSQSDPTMPHLTHINYGVTVNRVYTLKGNKVRPISGKNYSEWFKQQEFFEII
jgi:hypothetical protein